MSFRNKDFNQNFKFGKNLYFLVISFLPIIFFLIYLKSNDLLEYYKNIVVKYYMCNHTIII